MKTLILFLFSCFFLQAYAPEKAVNEEMEKVNARLITLQNSGFSEENLIEYMHLIGVREIQFSLKMSKLETANFTSFLFEHNDNLFGMRHPSVRPTTSRASIYKHAFYSHWTESVQDYKLWQDYYHSKGWDLSNYPAFIKKVGYSVNPNYVKIVNTVKI